MRTSTSFFYAFQRDWLERYQINFQAIHSLWDIVNNVWDNLDEIDISMDELTSALRVVEEMNSMATEVEQKGTPTDEGLVFSGTREAYETLGSTLLEKRYDKP